MKKLLVICGPTATGKTRLGIELAKKFGGEILSADSRQVYRGMDIVTGKEWDKGVKIWGYDLVEPKESFSVAQFIEYGRGRLIDIWRRKRLPIVVGGTGLYIKGLVDGIATAAVPPNKALRKKLARKTTEELFEILGQMDSFRAGQMNASDRRNPRRLIRAIEIAMRGPEDIKHQSQTIKAQVLFIGLTATTELLHKRIERRVAERIAMGAGKEIEKLKRSGVGPKHQSWSAIGYQEEDPEAWVRAEVAYAKRQLAWFKKDKRIKWFDVAKEGYEKKVEKLVQKWYSKGK